MALIFTACQSGIQSGSCCGGASGACSSDPTYFVNVNGMLIFRADNGTNGCEQWKSNGTTAGTVMIADINPGVPNGMNGSLIRHSAPACRQAGLMRNPDSLFFGSPLSRG